MRAQQGQVLLECVIVLGLLVLGTVWAGSQWNQTLMQARIQSMAYWLLDIQKAIGQETDFMTLFNQTESASSLAGVHGSKLVESLIAQERLPKGFSVQAPMDYEVSLSHVKTQTCEKERCTQWLLLLARPREINELTVQNTLDLRLVLGAQAGVVLPHQNDRLLSSVWRLSNPLPGHANRLPEGTIALALWQSGHLPPYVRLNENRPIHLSGPLTLEGPVVATNTLDARQGVVLGTQGVLSGQCASLGQVVRLQSGGLGLCENGHWQAVSAVRRALRACHPATSGQPRNWYPGFFGVGHDDGMNGSCECDSGYIPQFVGRRLTSFEQVQVHQGFVCESRN
ncbi:hypothetical protein [Orrella sp. 11846]|uniref:hypothetical protein n=1 Tax=Orrella sp. 11846 TaxID=3409913 RepID=UPI003B597AA7